jgi:hypothetical protein
MQYNVADLNQIYMHARGRFSVLPTETCIMRAEGFWINNLGEQVLARVFLMLIYNTASERASGRLGTNQIELSPAYYREKFLMDTSRRADQSNLVAFHS